MNRFAARTRRVRITTLRAVLHARKQQAPHFRELPAQIDTAGVGLMLEDNSSGANMFDEMGSFRVDVEIENPLRAGERRILRGVLVDTGAELSWFPAEVMESLGLSRVKQLRFRQRVRADVGRVVAQGAVSISLAVAVSLLGGLVFLVRIPRRRAHARQVKEGRWT